MKKCRIALLIKVSTEFGFGHFYRAMRIIDMLKDKYELYLISNRNIEIVEICQKNNVNLIMLNSYEIIDCLKKKNVDILIVDHLNSNYKNILEYKSIVKKIVLMDDNGSAAKYADVLINGLVTLPKKCPIKSFSGIKYIIFSDEIEKYSTLPVKYNKINKKVFVSFGGSDPNNLTELIIPIIQLNCNVEFTLVLGVGYKNKNNFINKYKSISNLTIYHNVNNMVELMYNSDLCIVSGGLTLYECVFLQKKIIVINQCKEQVSNTIRLMDIGSIINLGIYSKITNKELMIIDQVIKGDVSIPDCHNIHMKNGKYLLLDIINNLMEEINENVRY